MSANFGVSDRQFRFKPAGGFGGNRQAVSVQSGTPLRMGFGPGFGEPPLRDTSYLALACGQWIDAVHQRRQPRVVVLDMDSSESPTYGEQEGSTTTAISGAPAIIGSSCSTSLAIWSAAPCGPETAIRLMAGGRFWSRSCRATGAE